MEECQRKKELEQDPQYIRFPDKRRNQNVFFKNQPLKCVFFKKTIAKYD